MPTPNRAEMESELKRLEMEEELSRLETEEKASLSAPVLPGPTLGEKVETGFRSALEGASFGLSEPVVSGASAFVSNLVEAGAKSEDVGQFFKQAADLEKLKKGYEADVERRKKLEAQLPEIALPAEIAGALISPIGSKVGALGKGVAAGVTRAVAPALEATQIASKLPTAAKISKAALEAGATAGAGEAIKQAAQIPSGFMEAPQDLTGVTEAGALIGGGLAAVPVLGKALKAGGAKTLSAFGGVREKVIKEYLEKPAPMLPVSPMALKEKVDLALNRVQPVLIEQRKQGADNVLLALKSLKDKVIKGSEEAFDILEKEGVSTAKKGAEKTISAPSIIDAIDKQISAQKTTSGDILLNEVRQKTAVRLNELKETIASLQAQIGDKFDLVTAKEIIKSLDEVTNYARSQGEFTPRLDVAFQAVRSNLNQQLRTLSKEYAKKMDEVSSNVKLLEAANDVFGTEAQALSGIQTLAVGKNPRINELANQLELASGVKIKRGIDAIKRTVPVEKMDPKTTEGFLKTVMGKETIEGKKTLKLLSELADEDLSRLAEDAAMTAEFQKIVQNGSRDVNFWKEVLSGLSVGGSVAGGALGGPGGAMVGASVGYLVKTFGAPVTKQILDGIITVRGIPTVQKINSALSGVNEATRTNLVNGFIRANIINMQKKEPEKVQFSEQNKAAVMEDLKTSSLDSVTKAKALQSLQKDGSVSTATLKQYMIGGKTAPLLMKPEQKNLELKRDRPDVLKKMIERSQ